MRKLLLMLFVLLGTGLAYAQNYSISGKVTDAGTGEPLPFVTVIEKGTNRLATTDDAGNYRLMISGVNAVIEFRLMGYNPLELMATSPVLNAALANDALGLDEVVVIGYGTQRRGDVSSAIVSIKADDFTTGKIGDAAELIKGKVAGLTIINATGDPNATSSIRLRGVSTLRGSVTPLVLIDGIQGDLNHVAPENIESIDVLKDASASAIYGTRGANGVIIITTKSGRRESRVEANYSSYLSSSRWVKKAKFMDAEDIRQGLTTFQDDGYETNWLDAISRTKGGFTQNHSLSMRGGTQKSTYSGNFTYRDETGIMRRSENMTMTTQLDFSQYALNDMLKININLLYRRGIRSRDNNTDRDGHESSLQAYRQAVIRNPTSPVYNPDGTYFEEFGRFQYYNPVAIQNEYEGDIRNNRARLTGNLTFEPIKGWQTNLMMSINENTSETQTYITSSHFINATTGIRGSASKASSNTRSDEVQLTSRYSYNKNGHRFNALAGYTYYYNVSDNFGAGNSNFPTESYLFNNMGQGTFLTDPTRTVSISSGKSDNTLIGFFGRVEYGYDNRYNVLVAVRREGSSRFGENNKWGTFPSISGAWNMHNENFMQGIAWLNEAKIRLGYGISGNNANSNYASLVLYNYQANSAGRYLTQDGRWKASLQATQNPNPNLRWEKTQELNFGLDWRLFNNRFSGSIDLYHKKTVDLLFSYNVPIPPNMYGTMLANVGEMLNKGIELIFNAVPVKTKTFEYQTTLTMSHNSNKLLSLSNDLYETNNFQELNQGIGDPISSNRTHCLEVGTRLGDFWMPHTVGVDENGTILIEVWENEQWVVKPYESRYQALSNRQRFQNGFPTIIAGWNHSFRYKGFDLNMQFIGQFGYYILNTQRVYYENNSIAYNRLKSAADYHPAVDIDLNPVIDPATGKQKMVRLSSTMQQGVRSDHLEKGDFVKFSNFTFGYSLPFKSNNFIRSARLYVSGQNLFCITGYSGIDPEVPISAQTPGVDARDKYPTVRTYTVGVNINF